MADFYPNNKMNVPWSLALFKKVVLMTPMPEYMLFLHPLCKVLSLNTYEMELCIGICIFILQQEFAIDVPPRAKHLRNFRSKLTNMFVLSHHEDISCLSLAFEILILHSRHAPKFCCKLKFISFHHVTN